MISNKKEVENKVEQKGNKNIALQNAKITIIINKLNDRMSSKRSSGEKTNDDVSGELIIWSIGLSLLLAGYLIYQDELLVYGGTAVIFFWGLVVLRILNFMRKGLYNSLNLQNKFSLISSMFFWLAIGGVMYFLQNPLYQSVQAAEVRAYITKAGFDGVFSRIIETFINHPGTVASFAFQSMSYVMLALLAMFLILDYVGFSITIIAGRMKPKSLGYKMIESFEKRMLRFRLNKAAIIGFSIIILMAFLSGSGVFAKLIEHAQHAQQANGYELSAFLHR